MSNHSGSDKGMDITDMIGVQKLTLERIKKMKTNYGKDSKDRKKKQYMLNKIDALNEEWETFKSNHKNIIQEFTKENVKLDYFKNDVYGEARDLHIEFLSDMQQFYEETYGPETRVYQISDNNTNEIQRPKLPAISLPKFNGDYQDWTSFRDLFVTLIHSNDKIPDVQKLYYLKTHLTDDAEQLLRHVNVTEANYAAAWETLSHRYENTRVLVNTQLKILLNQKNILTESAEAIRKILDTTSECLKALQNLGLGTLTWDPLIIYLTTQKLPSETHQMWEHSISQTKELPTFDCLKQFLEARFRTLEVVETSHRHEKEQRAKVKLNSSTAKTLHSTYSNSCCYCQGNHSIRQCDSYKQLEVSNRFSIANQKGLCLNCLSKGHQTKKCSSKWNCKDCGKRHHYLLHYARSNNSIVSANETVSDTNTTSTNQSEESDVSTSLHSNLCTKVLLATAMIKVESLKGIHTLRALIDQGSQSSFITESAAQLLQLSKTRTDITVKGIGNNNQQTCRSKVRLKLISAKNDKAVNIDAIVIKKITSLLPGEEILAQHWPHIKGLLLADPTYSQPGKIDILLGADVYAEILTNGIRQGPYNTPMAQNTIFGWIISGKTIDKGDRKTTMSNMVTFHNRIEIDNILKRFWEIEEIPQVKPKTEEELQCEKLFATTHERDDTGRYIVNLPFKNEEENPCIGKSRHIAMARFLQN